MSNKLDDLYAFAGKKEEDRSFVKVLRGPLAGAIIKIHTIKFGDHENPDGTMDLAINHDFVEQPSMTPTKEQVDEYMGMIVVDIIQNYMLSGGDTNLIEVAD